MRATEFIKEQTLDEVAMTPNALNRLVSKINALAGMEFEMYVPDVENASSKDQEPDYSDNPRPHDINSIIEFFSNGDADSEELSNLEETLRNEYEEWATERLDRQWNNDQVEVVKTYITRNEWDEDAALEAALENNNLSPEQIQEVMAARADAKINGTAKYLDTPVWRRLKDASRDVEAALDEQVTKEIANQSRIYNAAYDEWTSDTSLESEFEWLSQTRINRMSDISNNYNISWPFWSNLVSGTKTIEEVANDFGDFIGKPVNWSDRYHGAHRTPGTYSVEPDGSLDDPKSDEDYGLEFISPPQPVSEMIKDFHNVKEWADQNYCYTNSSTGLHINVSIDATDQANLDYVKLAILLGDYHVLEQFNRVGSAMCRSSVYAVTKAIETGSNSLIPEILDQMRQGLNHAASKLIMSKSHEKYFSINTQSNYVEFRAPGGDWLNEHAGKIEPTLLRMVVALDAAYDPQKYRREYLTKLYKMMAPKGSEDPIAYFVKYAAGEIPQSAMMSYVRHLSQKRNNAPTANYAQPMDFKLWTEDPPREVVVSTTSIGNAKRLARAAWKIGQADVPDRNIKHQVISRTAS